MANKEKLERQLSQRASRLETRLAAINVSPEADLSLVADDLKISELAPESSTSTDATQSEKACHEELEQIRQKLRRLQQGQYPACQICEDVITFEDHSVLMQPGYCGPCAEEIDFVRGPSGLSRLQFSLTACGLSGLVILIILIW